MHLRVSVNVLDFAFLEQCNSFRFLVTLPILDATRPFQTLAETLSIAKVLLNSSKRIAKLFWKECYSVEPVTWIDRVHTHQHRLCCD
jgi:hypothetical protein